MIWIGLGLALCGLFIGGGLGDIARAIKKEDKE